jgi:WD40 repeat protein
MVTASLGRLLSSVAVPSSGGVGTLPPEGGTPAADAGPARGGESAEPAGPLPSIPGYKVLGELGQGGMGIVYQARQLALNRLVALKMIRAGAYAGGRERARFQTEAEAVARLRHPNIVQVYEVGAHEGRPYLALEFVAGGSLSALLRGTPQPPRQAAELVEALARAIDYAHGQGVVHRDLKPANILLARVEDRAGSDDPPSSILDPRSFSPSAIKITDFGLAKQLGEDPGQTGSGTILGTPSYMAPEQASPSTAWKKGPDTGVGPAADVYALGAVLYEMLTGRPPFKGATVLDTLEQVRSQEPVPPRRLQPKVPRDLETICLKCLEKEPRRRYASAQALADDLRAFRDGRPIKARPVGRWEHAAKWAKRHPAVAGLAAAIVAVVLVGFTLVIWQWQSAVSARRETEAERRRAELLLARSYRDRGQALAEQGDVGRGMLWLAHALATVPEKSPDLRRAIRASLAAWRHRLHPLRHLIPHPAPVQAAGFSPRGQVLLTVDADHRARLWEAATGRPIGRAMEHPDEVLATAFHPNGRLVVTGCADGKARLWETASGRPVREPFPHKGAVRAVAFGGGGKTLVTGSSDKKVRLWDTNTGKLLDSGEHRGRVLAVAVSPDGNTVLTGSADGTARLWSVTTATGPKARPGQVTLQLAKDQPPPQGSEVRTVAFSPDGKYLLTVSRNERKRGERAVMLWDVGKRKLVGFLPHHYWVRAVAFSPDGKTLLTGSEDHTAQLWEADTGWPLGHALQHQDTVRAVAFSPDGKTLLTGSDDRTARLWDAATQKPIGQPLEHQGPVHAVAFNPADHTLLTASRDQTARLWEPAPTRPFLHEFDQHAQVMALAWSPDGRSLVTGTDAECAWRWQVNADKALSPPLKHKDDVWAVAYSPDGRTILTGSRDKTVRLWDAATGKRKKEFKHRFRVRSAAFSPDGRTILAEGGDGGGGEARLWDLATGRPLGQPLEVQGVVWQVAFRPDGKVCAIASGESTVRLWDLASRKSWALAPRHQARVVALAFSPDGQKLLTGSTDKTARLWDAATGQPLGDPLHHAGAVWGVAFSADGRTVVTGGTEGCARLWDAAAGVPVGPPLLHGGVVWAVACPARGRTVLTGSADKTARLWEIPEPVEGSRERITLWVQVLTAMELDANGVAHWLDAATWKQRRQRLHELGGPPLP